MRVFMTVFGTYGDVRPLLSIARQLKQGGAKVVFFSNPFFEEKVRSAGVGWRGVGERIDPEAIVRNERLRHPHLGPIRIWREVFEPLVAKFYDAIMAEVGARGAGRPAMIVNHPWCFGGAMAAEKLKAPWSMVSLAPLTWFSGDDPPQATGLEPPRWMRRWVVEGPLRWMLNGGFGPDLDRFAHEHGLPKVKHRYFWSLRGAALNLGMWSPAVRGPAEDDPPQSVICGFPESYPTRPPPPLDAKVEAFLEAGEAPLVLGMGSALPPLFPNIYAEVWRACERLGWRAVLVGAPEGSVPTDEERLCVVPYAPYTSLFPRARVIVHHGGIGSLAESVAAGRPQLVLPQGTDQYDNAWRAELLGVGARCAPKRIRAKRLAKLLDALDRDDAVEERARALARAVAQEESGAVVAARAIREAIARAG